MDYSRRISKQVKAFERNLMRREMTSLEKFSKPGWEKKINAKVDHKFHFNEPSLVWAAIVSYTLSMEALMNLVYSIYMRKEIAADTELVEKINLYSAKDKWLMAYAFCDCFGKPLGKNTKGYQSLAKLTSLRNNIAHSNISKERRTYIYLEDGIEFPILPDKTKFEQMPRPSDVSSGDAEKVRIEVQTFVDELIHSMKPRIRKEFSKLIKGNSVLVSKSNRRIRNPWLY